jgi:hypothetical protein
MIMKYKYTNRKYPQTHRLLAKPQEDCHQTSRRFFMFCTKSFVFCTKNKNGLQAIRLVYLINLSLKAILFLYT